MGLYVWARFGPHDISCGMKGYRADLVRLNGGFDTSKAIGTELALNSIRRGLMWGEARNFRACGICQRALFQRAQSRRVFSRFA
jgi:hypothetical protein